MNQSARASAPASIGNIGVGYDVLGQAFDVARDTVLARREREPGARLGRVTGLVDRLPSAPGANTALAAAAAVLEAAAADFGVRIDIDKQIPISAGMGGSAASAVAAAAAVNALLDRPYQTADLLAFALEGEKASADPPPWDNVMAALLGGLVIAARLEPALIAPIPAPAGISAVLFHPEARTETAAARNVLADQVPMQIAVEHARRISAFTLGCATGNHALIRAGLDDILVEPQRAFLLPELPAVKAAALKAGALGCSFSGSGPSVFAWADDDAAGEVEAAMAKAFEAAGRPARAYRAALACDGVRLEPVAEKVR
ncbi:homoserine kinase [Hyphobacterium sp.]|uniref:homoserine kinase n=1 Tax=Hyphobacterium sp. TaxID=2004662 RepID=UPI003B518957